MLTLGRAICLQRGNLLKFWTRAQTGQREFVTGVPIIVPHFQNVKAGSKLVESDREFYLEGDYMVIKQTVGSATGLRYFKRE